MTLHFNPIGYLVIAVIGLVCLAITVRLTMYAAEAGAPDTIGVVLIMFILVGPSGGTIYGEYRWYQARHPMPPGCVKERVWVLLQDAKGTPVPVVTTNEWRWNCPD